MAEELLIEKKVEVLLPSRLAEDLGRQYESEVSKDVRKNNAQFFTSKSISDFMASIANAPEQNKVRILDPGSGVGILSCSLIESFIDSPIKEIELILFEIDSAIIPYLKRVMSYLEDWLKSKEINLNWRINNADFCEEVISKSTTDFGGYFDYIISNPPYFKIKATDLRREKGGVFFEGVTNIYAFFLLGCSRLIGQQGELIFITPRSFTSGYYFKKIRKNLLENNCFTFFHLFQCRSSTFDNVLQETVIYKLRKRDFSIDSVVKISTSENSTDLRSREELEIRESVIVDLESENKFINIPTNENEILLLEKARRLNYRLEDLNIKISTGPVVSGRSQDFIVRGKNKNTFPLIWMESVRTMDFRWPNLGSKDYQFITNGIKETFLVKNQNLVLLRRFSTKDDRSRLIANPYLKTWIKSDFLGIENKVNYLYSSSGLDEETSYGLSILLNSSFYNNYFQIFNGNTNVSATEIEEMKFPDMDTIKNIGRRGMALKEFELSKIDLLEKEFLGL